MLSIIAEEMAIPLSSIDTKYTSSLSFLSTLQLRTKLEKRKWPARLWPHAQQKTICGGLLRVSKHNN